jgi:hypothetical protein
MSMSSSAFADAAHALFDDVEATLVRMRRDAAHLRELGQRASVGASLAAQAAKASAEQVVDVTLDRLEHAFETLKERR